MNPCKIQIFRYSFKGVTVLSLKGKCTYYPVRCKRKRSQWNTRSLLPVALSERKLLDSMLPRALPWANFLLGFQPVFAACKHFVQDKTTEFQAKWGNGSNISHRCNGITRNDTAVSWTHVKFLLRQTIHPMNQENVVYCSSSHDYGQGRGKISTWFRMMITPGRYIAVNIMSNNGAKFQQNDNL